MKHINLNIGFMGDSSSGKMEFIYKYAGLPIPQGHNISLSGKLIIIFLLFIINIYRS